jgi:hypothetical protein
VRADAVAVLDYPTLTELAVRGAGSSTITNAGVGHGLLVWFDTVLVEGVGYSSAPGAPQGIYGQMFFPWPEQVALQAGDRVAFELRADPIGADYLWTWTTEIGATRFRQSTFKSFPPSRDSLRKRSRRSRRAVRRGAEALAVLEGMRAGRTIGQIAGQLLAAHPSASSRSTTRTDSWPSWRSVMGASPCDRRPGGGSGPTRAGRPPPAPARRSVRFRGRRRDRRPSRTRRSGTPRAGA